MRQTQLDLQHSGRELNLLSKIHAMKSHGADRHTDEKEQTPSYSPFGRVQCKLHAQASQHPDRLAQCSSGYVPTRRTLPREEETWHDMACQRQTEPSRTHGELRFHVAEARADVTVVSETAVGRGQDGWLVSHSN